jgi:hypothetical protein
MTQAQPTLPSTKTPTVSSMLRKVSRDIDLDLAVTVADVMNVYGAALKRTAGRSTLGPEDSIKILYIINTISEACEAKGDMEIFGKEGAA